MYSQRVTQEFNVSVGSHVSIVMWTLQLRGWVEGGRGDTVSPPNFAIYHYFAIYNILLYILFCKTIISFQKI